MSAYAAKIGRSLVPAVIAVTQQIDLSGPVGHLIASLLFGIAEIELQHVKERQAVGIALARAWRVRG